jgi:hypothetical protein
MQLTLSILNESRMTDEVCSSSKGVERTAHSPSARAGAMLRIRIRKLAIQKEPDWIRCFYAPGR